MLQVLDIAKIEAGKLDLEMEPFYLSRTISDAKLFNNIKRQDGVKLIDNVDSNYYPGLVEGDLLRIRQILANVLSNAIKFCNAGIVEFSMVQEWESEEEVLICYSTPFTQSLITANARFKLFGIPASSVRKAPGDYSNYVFRDRHIA